MATWDYRPSRADLETPHRVELNGGTDRFFVIRPVGDGKVFVEGSRETLVEAGLLHADLIPPRGVHGCTRRRLGEAPYKLSRLADGRLRMKFVPAIEVARHDRRFQALLRAALDPKCPAVDFRLPPPGRRQASTRTDADVRAEIQATLAALRELVPIHRRSEFLRLRREAYERVAGRALTAKEYRWACKATTLQGYSGALTVMLQIARERHVEGGAA